MKKTIIKNVVVIAAAALLVLFSYHHFTRFDLTSEKRYSLSENTKKLMGKIDGDVKVNIYLDGDLSAGYMRLRKGTKEMLDEFSAYTKGDISYAFVNPTQGKNEKEHQKNYEKLEKKGLHLFLDNEDKDENGQYITRVICPWAEISYKGKTMPVCLMKEVGGKSKEENLNYSIENLEYALTDAMRQLTSRDTQKIAFIEGHGEAPDILTYDISQTLSKYYEVDRGQIGNDPTCLNGFKAIIIAAPTGRFSEQDKYVIDQYIMHGGKVLWLLDGVRISLDSLRTSSTTIGIGMDNNLQDQLFNYGVRIAPVLLQDVQCALIPMNTARAGDAAKFSPTSWYYSPLLLTSPVNPITKNLTPIASEFASGIESVGDTTIKREILLETSTGTHVQMMPSLVSMNIVNVEKNGQYFNTGNVPVAVSLSGKFRSNFTNRMVPTGIINSQMPMDRSFANKMIVIADGDIIKNNVSFDGNQPQIVPLGYNEYMKQQFGNKDFILNCVNYLTDDEGWMQLRSRELTLRMLNKPAIIGQRRFWQVFNVVTPLLILGVFGVIYNFRRKRKFGEKQKDSNRH